MEDRTPAEPPAARPSVRTAVLILLVLLVAALVWLGYRISTSGPQPPDAAERSTPACATPPTPRASAQSFTTAPDPSVAAGATWAVRVRTTCGDVLLALDGARAPRSVASFVTLARAGYWTDSVCHRLTSRQAPTKLLQCGDPTGRSRADPGYDLPLENVPADRTYRVGDVGMARGDGFPGTAGEFFVVHREFTVPPGAPVYSLIGKVTSGQEVVQQVASQGGEDTRPDGPPFQSVSVLSVDVLGR